MLQPGKKRQLKVSLGDPRLDFKESSAQEQNELERSTKRPKITNMAVFATLHSLNSSKYEDVNIPYKQLISIGRSSSKNNDIIIRENDCSSLHCQFVIGESLNNRSLILVKDFSSNGTYINDVIVGRNNSALLRDGDKISFASSLHFIVSYHDAFRSDVSSFFDEYILTNKVLGTGHYAQVKEARNRKTGVVCAVKIFNPTNISEDANQLNRELEILMNLNHPNIVGFYDKYIEPVNINSMTTFLVLEKVNGGELFNRIVTKGKLGQEETKEITRQLLQGLEYLHSKDIVHRDLKPENILLSIIPARPNQKYKQPWDEGELSVQVKIADFGLAKSIGKFQFTTTLCGTPAYVAPEVLANSQYRKYNKSVDMWSVGVLLYVCLCGFPPFSEELGPPSMRQQILEAKFAFYSPYWDEIDDIALDLISRLLVVNPDKRLTVEQATLHPWFRQRHGRNECVDTQETVDTQEKYFDDIVSLTARQLSIRIPASSAGYPCEPITIQERVNTGLTDDKIVERFCKFNHKNDADSDMAM